MRSDLGRLLEGVEGVAVATPIRYFDVKRLKPGGGSESLSFMAVDLNLSKRDLVCLCRQPGRF